MALYLHFVNKNVFVFYIFVAFNENILCVLFYFTKTRTAKTPCMPDGSRAFVPLSAKFLFL